MTVDELQLRLPFERQLLSTFIIFGLVEILVEMTNNRTTLACQLPDLENMFLFLAAKSTKENFPAQVKESFPCKSSCVDSFYGR